jgi:hypothetical protein
VDSTNKPYRLSSEFRASLCYLCFLGILLNSAFQTQSGAQFQMRDAVLRRGTFLFSHMYTPRVPLIRRRRRRAVTDIKNFIIAAVALRSEFEDVAANLNRILDWIDTASERGADLVCFPEIALQGYCSQPGIIEWLAETASGRSCRAIARRAREQRIASRWEWRFGSIRRSINSQVYIGPSITASALSRDTSTPAGWERGEGRPRRSSQILGAARGPPS